MARGVSSRLERSIAQCSRPPPDLPVSRRGHAFCSASAPGCSSRSIDKKDFPNFGIAVWWAIVTLATVGYGDVVPHTPWGRVVGSVVIVLGVTFLAFLTATVTSFFVSAQQNEAQQSEREHRVQQEQNLAAALERLEERLTAIENEARRPPLVELERLRELDDAHLDVGHALRRERRRTRLRARASAAG